jgi:hypothetical protein
MVGMTFDDGRGRQLATWPPPSPAPATAIKPGVIPLRPLMLTDIFNAALTYVRVNPKTALGLTAIVVVIAQIIVLIINGEFPVTVRLDDESAATIVSLYARVLALLAINGLAGVLLSGMLTVVVGRAVFGAPITMREARSLMGRRLWALLGFTVLQGLAVGVLIGVPFALIAATNQALPVVAVLIGFPLLLCAILLVVYLWTMVTFTPAIIVLERMPVLAAIKRSFALIRRSFWRVFGITVLAKLVAQALALALAWPFRVGGEVLQLVVDSRLGKLGAVALSTVGLSIGDVIILPFLAGVVVLLYTDRRMRAEAFDLVLQTGASGDEPSGEADSTDRLWQIRHP